MYEQPPSNCTENGPGQRSGSEFFNRMFSDGFKEAHEAAVKTQAPPGLSVAAMALNSCTLEQFLAQHYPEGLPAGAVLV